MVSKCSNLCEAIREVECWEGEAPAEPVAQSRFARRSRLGGSLALPNVAALQARICDLTNMLQGLVAKGLLDQRGQKRGAFYVLAKSADSLTDSQHIGGDSQHNDGSSQHIGANSSHIDGSSLHKPERLSVAGVDGAEPAPGTTPAGRDSLHTSVSALVLFLDSLHTADQFPDEEWERLRVISKPALDNDRLTLEQTRAVILELCQRRLLTAIQLGDLMNRNPDSLRNRFLSRMVEEELLLRRFPNEPNRPDQAYTTRPATIRTTDLAR